MNADHKFVKTTPKPNATKNSSGEEVGPVPGLLLCVDIVVGDDDVEDIEADDALCVRRVRDGVGLGRTVVD
jgi:hypothetical protein